MPRAARCAPAGFVYHVLNRAVARLTLFEKVGDYQAFQRVLQEAQARIPLPILSFCLMPNHWHFVVQPRDDHQVTDFFRWLTHTHTMRWHAHHHTSGTGHLYQARFKSFPIEDDDHLYTVLRYVERNPRRANLVEHAQPDRLHDRLLVLSLTTGNGILPPPGLTIAQGSRAELPAAAGSPPPSSRK